MERKEESWAGGPPGRFRLPEPAIVVVGGAGPFGGDHWRAQWMFRRADGAEGGTLPRLENSPKHFPRPALDRLAHFEFAQAKPDLGIEIGELRAEVADLALQAASQVVGETMTSERERRLVDEFLRSTTIGGSSR